MPHSSDITLLYLIKQVELAIRSHLDEVVGAEGLPSLQYTALTVLERRPGLTSAELARNSFIRPQTMAQMTAYLEGHDFVRREPDPNSKRQVLLFLTDEGARAISRLKPAVAGIEEDMVGDRDEEQVRQLRVALQSSRQSLAGAPPH